MNMPKLGQPDPSDPLKNRRTMAWISMITILLTLGASFYVILFGDKETADVARSMSSIINTVLGCLILQVGDYSHSARKRDHEP